MRHNTITSKKIKSNLKRLIIVVAILLVIFVLSVLLLKTFVYPIKHFDIIKQEAAKNDIDPYLVLAVIKTESGFNKEATSNKQAKGLMQIMDSTASDINDDINLVENINENIYDADINIALGCKYFAKLIKKYNGNYYLAICAYNAGMGNVDSWLDNGIVDKNLNEYIDVKLPFNQTKKYLYKVISAYKMYRILY
jgi:soluble lytic murein transglycosylase